jgi:hypothetical protein
MQPLSEQQLSQALARLSPTIEGLGRSVQALDFLQQAIPEEYEPLAHEVRAMRDALEGRKVYLERVFLRSFAWHWFNSAPVERPEEDITKELRQFDPILDKIGRTYLGKA